MSSIFKKPKVPPPPPPPAPLPKLEQALPDDQPTGRKRRKGRSSTILTGDLVPMDLGKRTLLG